MRASAEGAAQGTYYYILTIPEKETLRGSVILLR